MLQYSLYNITDLDTINNQKPLKLSLCQFNIAESVRKIIKMNSYLILKKDIKINFNYKRSMKKALIIHSDQRRVE